MRLTAAALSLLFVCLLCPAPSSAKVLCTNTWYQGTLVVVTTGEPGDAWLTFMEPGLGSEADDCIGDDLSSPAFCHKIKCGDAEDCINGGLGIPWCYNYLVSTCSGTAPNGTPILTMPTLRTWVEISQAPCQ